MICLFWLTDAWIAGPQFCFPANCGRPRVHKQRRQDLCDIQGTAGLTSGFVAQDPAKAARYADLVVVMSMGVSSGLTVNDLLCIRLSTGQSRTRKVDPICSSAANVRRHACRATTTGSCNRIPPNALASSGQGNDAPIAGCSARIGPPASSPALAFCVGGTLYPGPSQTLPPGLC